MERAKRRGGHLILLYILTSLFLVIGGRSPPDIGEICRGNEAGELTCHIRTLNSDLNFQNLTLGQSSSSPLTTLRLLCNEVLVFESRLSPGLLSPLVTLHELSIKGCRLKHLGSESLKGLSHLRSLEINTGAEGGRGLEISPRALTSVPALRHLHLGFNQVRSLPKSLLCPLHNLQSLNLTGHRFVELADLSLPQSSSSRGVNPAPCLGELKNLDLSHGTLRALAPHGFQTFRRLVELHLEHNQITELDPSSLAGLTHLKVLNLSSNLITSIPANLLQGSSLIRELDLRNNSLSSLGGLLGPLEQLQSLDLSRNNLSSLTADGLSNFHSLVRCIILDLSHNKISNVSGDIFAQLYSLQLLDLSDNLISSVEGGALGHMSNLHSLNLARNRLGTVGVGLLHGLFVLSRLNLDHNQLTLIEDGALNNVTSLTELGLAGNLLSGVPKSLSPLSRLQTLDLGENQISGLSNSSFAGLAGLIGLRLVDNELDSLPAGLCDPMPSLRVFNGAQNKIRVVSPMTFVSCPELRVLRLDSNGLEALPESLPPQLPNLLWLNVSVNSIHESDFSKLPSTLEWFDISHNQLMSLGSVPSNPPSSLRVLRAASNRLEMLTGASIPPSLELLQLNDNRLNRIGPDTFSRSGSLRRVELIGNSLETLQLPALRLPPVAPGKPLPEILIGGNPFLCDCEMEWLMRLAGLSSTRQYPMVLDLDSVLCRFSHSRSIDLVSLPLAAPQDFVCPYTSHCFALCECCEFDACDCAMTCPANCTCFHDSGWTANIVNCGGSALSSVPTSLPMDSTVVWLDGNEIPTLRPHTFIGRKNLRVLYLNSSGIEILGNKSFNGLVSLISLHLDGNRVTHLWGHEFESLSGLRELYLQDNQISFIANTTFLSLKGLEILRLNGNRLGTFSAWQLSLNPYLVEIRLGQNPWTCDCGFISQFSPWLLENSKKVGDLEVIGCARNGTKSGTLPFTDFNRTCGGTEPWALASPTGSEFSLDRALELNLPMSLILSIGTAILLISILGLLVFRTHLKICVYNRFGVRICQSPKFDPDKSYDAYLLYSAKDAEVVTAKFVEELETVDGFRLCLHYRDLQIGSGDLREMIQSGVEASHTLVLCLSRNFLQGELAEPQYRAGLKSVLDRMGIKGKLPRLLIIWLEPLDFGNSQGADIRALTSRAAGVLKFGQPIFWSKLKYFLPEPCPLYQSNGRSQTTTTSSASSVQAELKYAEPTLLTSKVPSSPTHSSGEDKGHQDDRPPSLPPPESIPSLLFQQNERSPVPLGYFPGRASQDQISRGQSYLSLDGDHVYSTLGPPRPSSKGSAESGKTQGSSWYLPQDQQRERDRRRRQERNVAPPPVPTYLV